MTRSSNLDDIVARCQRHGCPAAMSCKDKGGPCVITDCGSGECRGCSFLKNLVVAAWCSYRCAGGGGWLAFSAIGYHMLGPFGPKDIGR